MHAPHAQIYTFERHAHLPTRKIKENFCFVYYDLCFNLWTRMKETRFWLPSCKRDEFYKKRKRTRVRVIDKEKNVSRLKITYARNKSDDEKPQSPK